MQWILQLKATSWNPFLVLDNNDNNVYMTLQEHQVFLGYKDNAYRVLIDKNEFHKMHRVYPIDVYLSRTAFAFVIKHMGSKYVCTPYDTDVQETINAIRDDLECALRFYNTVQNWSTRREHSQVHRILK